jgi:hypothetical protein
MAVAVLTALAGGAVLGTVVELRVAAAWRDGDAALHAAEGALAVAFDELAAMADWTPVLAGAVHSSHRDGPPGPRPLRGGRAVDLLRETNLLRCGRTSCTEAQAREASADRPWGPANPSWELYLHAPLRAVGPGADAPDMYVAVWVGDDPNETDGDPRRDGPGAGEGRLVVRARAWGSSGVARTVEVLAGRTSGGVARLSWSEIR